MFGLTKEADGALRVVWLLARRGETTSAAELSRQIAVPPQFLFKILRQLSQVGLVNATRGKSGGYVLAIPPEHISVRRVVELIDGPICINRCQREDFHCSRMGDNKQDCRFHCLFASLSYDLAARLDGISIRDMMTDPAPIL